MKVAQIVNGEVVNVLLLSQPMLEQFQEATGYMLIPIPDEGDVIVGDLYNEEDKVFHRPETLYDDEGGVEIISLSKLREQLDEQEAAILELAEIIAGGGL